MADIFSFEGLGSLDFVIVAFVVGIVIACAGMLYQIKIPGKVVRTLLAAEALGEASALDASAFGFPEWLLRFILKDTGALAKYVKVIPVRTRRRGKSTEPVYAEAKYYLLPETKERASIRYERRRASVGALIAAMILFPILGAILLTVIPDLVQMVNNFINMF